MVYKHGDCNTALEGEPVVAGVWIGRVQKASSGRYPLSKRRKRAKVPVLFLEPCLNLLEAQNTSLGTVCWLTLFYKVPVDVCERDGSYATQHM